MEATVTIQRNVYLHHVRAEVEAVVDGTITDDVEDIKGDMQVPKDQLMPHWSHQNQ